MKLRNISALLLALAVAAGSVSSARAAGEGETRIVLSDKGVTVDGKAASTDDSGAVYVGGEIIYYRDGTDETYGEGKDSEKHSAQEAEAHTVVTITRPGTYRLTGSLSKGQIFVDLGKDAKRDPEAVVTLVLDNVDITCTVAPAVFFYRVYECDEAFVAYDEGETEDFTPSAVVDTSAAGANVVLAAGSVNRVTGSHVARIYKEGTTKKLHKYDAAFYSKMSMNLSGDNGDDSGALNIIADNEGLDSELHLTINGGSIHIESQDDGINTNEDGVSVTTVNGGSLSVVGGQGSEGDGIDSNGYLVINGGTVWATANPRTGDGGIDADSPILINGGTVYAFGSRNDAADSSSAQPYMELSFASTLPAGSQVRVMDESGELVIGTILSRDGQSVTLSSPDLKLNTTYHVYVDGVLQCYSGNSFGMMRPDGMSGGLRPEGMEPPEGFQRPDDGFDKGQRGDFDPSQFGGELPEDGRQFPEPPDGQRPQDGQTPPDLPEGFDPSRLGRGGMGGGFPGGDVQADGSGSTDFILTETTKSFSGVCDSDASGKTRVSFAVEGVDRSGRSAVIGAITAITPSVEVNEAIVQITVTDDPSESYAATCALSDGLEAVNALLPEDDGDYLLTVAIRSGDETYTGATQIAFTVGALPFADVREGDEGYAAIKALYKAGAMNGTGEGTFSPDMTVTRAQAVTVLARLAGAEEEESDDFSDVESGSWYAGYVGWAVENGIVEGDGAGHFFPDMTVTGEQLKLMMGRYLQDYAGYEPSVFFPGGLTRSQLAQMLEDIM